MEDVCFSFGNGSPPYSAQCKRQGIELLNADKWDDLVNKTLNLYVNGILTESRYDECLNRILKQSMVDRVPIKEDIEMEM